MKAGEPLSTRTRELIVFAAMGIAFWPIVAVGIVGSWGLAVWIYYSLAGPPGPG